MRKKIFVTMLIIVLAVCLLAGCSNKYTTALVNGSFDNVSTDNVVLGWKQTSSSSEIKFLENIPGTDSYVEELGKKYAYFDCGSAIKATKYISQTVHLKAGKTYELKAMVKADKISPVNNVGARVGFLEDSEFLGINVTKASTEWQEYTVYFNVQKSGELTLIATLGTKNDLVAGSVGFDNISLTAVDKVPSGYTGIVSTVSPDNAKTLSTPVSISFIVVLAIVGVFMLYALYFMLRKVSTPIGLRPVEKQEKLNKVATALSSPFSIFLFMLVGAFVVRFILLLTTYGFDANLDKIGGFVTYINEKGFMNSISASTGLNQPVGIVYLLGLMGFIVEKAGIEIGSLGYTILLRMPALIADIVICYMIYGLGQKHLSGDSISQSTAEKRSAIFASIYAFVPVFFVYGVLYSSLNVISFAFIVAMMSAILDKKYVSSGIYYMLALAFNNYALLLLPVVLVFQIYGIVKEPKQRLVISVSMVLSLVIFFALSIVPCYNEIAKGNVIYIFKKMFTFFKTQTLLSDNSFGLYAIFGVGNVMTRSTIFEVFNWLFVCAMAALVAIAYVLRHNRLSLVLMSSVMVGAYALLGAGSVIDILPMALLIMLVYLAVSPEKRVYNCFVGLSTTSFINMAMLMSINGVITSTQIDKVYNFLPKNVAYILFSVVSVALLIYYLFAAIDIVAYDKEVELPPLQRKMKDELAYICSFKWVKKSK